MLASGAKGYGFNSHRAQSFGGLLNKWLVAASSQVFDSADRRTPFKPGALRGLWSLAQGGFGFALTVGAKEAWAFRRTLLDADFRALWFSREGLTVLPLSLEGKPPKKSGLVSVAAFFADHPLSGDRDVVFSHSNLPLPTGFHPHPFHGDWGLAVGQILTSPRKVVLHRKTKETDLKVTLNPDGHGRSHIHTGLSFFDHMLEQIARHGGIDLDIHVKGDLEVDEHHTVEDTGIALGEALRKAVGDKRGLSRYGSSAVNKKGDAVALLLPMDEALASCALDFSGRSHLVFTARFRRERVGDLPLELVKHFFEAVTMNARINLHLTVKGENDHHQVEALFKAFARALRQALARSGNDLPSTKGVL